MPNTYQIEELVEQLQQKFPEKQIKVTFKYDKVILHFVTDKFYDYEFESYYDCALALVTLMNFTKNNII